MNLYERINLLCKEKEITGKELGEKLGLKKSPLTDWKNQKSKPTVDQIIMMCEIFATSADYLLLERNASDLTKEESEIIQAYKKADARTQEIVKLSLQPYMPQETKLSDSQIG